MKRILSLLSALALAATLCIGVPLSALADEPTVDGTEEALDASAQVADPSEYGDRTEVTGGKVAVTGDLLPNGIYDIDVTTDSNMFNVTSCRLNVQDGVMTATLTLSGTGYERIFMGSGVEAAAADPSLYAEAEVSNGSYTYTVEVPALNVVLPCSAFSAEKQKWYDHDIVFEASSIDGSIMPAYLYMTENPNPLSSAADIDLEAGTYQMDVVLNGGTGKASVTSPCTITVVGGKATATIEWSSEYYDYMVVDGYIYYPTNTEGNSTFEIPVVAYDEPFDVIGDTVAMSTPHEISYTLTFDSATAKAASSGANGFILPTIIGVVAVIVIVIIVALARSRKKKAADNENAQ